MTKTVFSFLSPFFLKKTGKKRNHFCQEIARKKLYENGLKKRGKNGFEENGKKRVKNQMPGCSAGDCRGPYQSINQAMDYYCFLS